MPYAVFFGAVGLIYMLLATAAACVCTDAAVVRCYGTPSRHAIDSKGASPQTSVHRIGIDREVQAGSSGLL